MKGLLKSAGVPFYLERGVRCDYPRSLAQRSPRIAAMKQSTTPLHGFRPGMRLPLYRLRHHVLPEILPLLRIGNMCRNILRPRLNGVQVLAAGGELYAPAAGGSYARCSGAMRARILLSRR